jgi:glucoamylase
MVLRAAAYLATHGPASPQDRWEEAAGYTPFTVAVAIAALLVAAELADTMPDLTAARYLRDTADAWAAGIDRWLYVTETDLANRYGVDGYYLRVAADDTVPQRSLVAGLDALALVRFGLRLADDPRITNTLRIADATLKVETLHGPVWRRYEGDSYGEYSDGRAYDGNGIGRAWPLLTAERAHYELAAGRTEAAAALAKATESIAGESGLLPEQVWDSADIPERELWLGGAAGSAMPLAWAHAEYVKLCRSLWEGRVFDQPPQTTQRYLIDGVSSSRMIWRFRQPLHAMPSGSVLRVETLHAAIIRWSGDGWRTVRETRTCDTTLGIHVADLDTPSMTAGSSVEFTFYWLEANRWEGANFSVGVVLNTSVTTTWRQSSNESAAIA